MMLDHQVRGRKLFHGPQADLGETHMYVERIVPLFCGDSSHG